MFELRAFEKRLLQKDSLMRSADELRVGFEHLQTNVREVEAEMQEHRRLKEAMEAEKNGVYYDPTKSSPQPPSPIKAHVAGEVNASPVSPSYA